MHESLKAHAVLRDSPSGCGLATITSVAGSSYRRPGARMILTPEGRRHGTISGGCLEEDLVLQLREVMATGASRTLTYDTSAENDLVWGVGLGCHGRVTLLLERIDRPPSGLAFVAETSAERRRGAVLTTIYDRAEANRLGSRLALSTDGKEWRDDLPPHWADPLLAAARSALESTASAWIEPPDRDLPAVFIEYIPPEPRLVVLGAGDDAQPLVRLAHELGWTVLVADPRPAYATSSRFPAATRIIAKPAGDIPGLIGFDAHTYAVLMTHHYVHDLPLLRALLPLDLPYLGLLGPRQRTERMLADLETGGLALTPVMRSGLHAPVGLDLGGDTPEAVALSILAELQSVREARNARPLRERTQPIHA